MKKIFPLFILFLIFSISKTVAQNLEVAGDSYITGKLGIGINAPQQKIDARGSNEDIGARLLLGNSDLSHKLLLFSGRSGNPRPFIQWKDGDPLRFGTDGGGFSERFRIASDGLITAQNRITNVTDPEDTQDAATKAYVDMLLAHYEIGDTAYGGIIFWVDETGKHGLVCDTIDASTGSTWDNGVLKVTNATGNDIGAGEMNTMLIIAQQTIDNTTGNFAALICANWVRGPYGDWYLPSKEELNLMYTNLHLAGLGGFSGIYWSSTEDDNLKAWIHKFSNGDQLSFSKAQPDTLVRAVRSF